MKLATNLNIYRSRLLGLGKGRGCLNLSTAICGETKDEKDLYRRISPVGSPGVSIVPLLDQWVEEGRALSKEDLQNIIKELNRYKRFKHALEVSQWMSDRRFFPLSPRDMATRLGLIGRVHGAKEADNYFDCIPVQSRSVDVYLALLNCYTRWKCLEKAEDIMIKLRSSGLARATLIHNAMLNLYYQTGNHEKLDYLMFEMEEKGIKSDTYTFSILLSAYAANRNVEGIDKTIQRMESYPDIVLDWNVYAVAANGYIKAGLVYKALEMLKKTEGLMLTSRRRSTVFGFLITQYAAARNKDEVWRLWELHKATEKVYNKGYISMISSLLKLDDIEGAERVLGEWESSELSCDFRIPNFLVGVYCRKGLMEKAEDAIKRATAKGGKPLTHTWYYLATGYVSINQISKAVEAMKLAFEQCKSGWKPSNDTLSACLEYLKTNGHIEEAERFIKSFQEKGVVSTEISDKLLNYVKYGKSGETALHFLKEDFLAGDGSKHKLESRQPDTSVGVVESLPI